MAPSTRIDKERLAGILSRQLNVITRRQALAAGLTKHAIQYRLRDGGPWCVLLPAIYIAVTGAPSQSQREMGALLYGGPGSVISGPAALPCHRIRGPVPEFIDVLVPLTCQRRDAEFVRMCRTRRLPGEFRDFGPLRYALAARAVGDTVRRMTGLREVRGVVADAVQRRGCTTAELVAELTAGPRRESALFREALSDVIGGIRSAAEGDLRDLIARAGLEMPLFNAEIYAGEEFVARPDGWYPELGIAIEVDSKEWHLGPLEHKKTLDRGNRMETYLINVLRFTPNVIRYEPERVISQIRDAIERAHGRPRLSLRTIGPET